MKNRRTFIRNTTSIIGGSFIIPFFGCANKVDANTSAGVAIDAIEDSLKGSDNWFDISLAQWSLHKTIFDKKLDNLEFAKQTKSMGIEAIEYVNQFFKDKAEDTDYLNQMNAAADGEGVKQLLIMIDGEGNLGDTNEDARTKAVENHYKWVNAAKYLGCHSIRVNAAGKGTAEEVGTAAADGLGRLSEYAAKEGLNVIVENHGGYSSDGSWLSAVMEQVGMDNCGTLPDFGNFCLERGENWSCKKEYDRYKGMSELLPFAKAISAKANDFDAEGNEIHTDFYRIMKMVKESGYKGYVGIEYEGKELSEIDGIMATKALLEKVRAAI